MMHISDDGLHLVETYEGLRLKAYMDTGGVWTIGWGHTGPEVKRGLVVTEEKAIELLVKDISVAEKIVNTYAMPCTQGEFDALTSFTFNLGWKQFIKSTLLKRHLSKDRTGAKKEFSRWVFDDGKRLEGLVKRRAAEAELYGSRS